MGRKGKGRGGREGNQNQAGVERDGKRGNEEEKRREQLCTHVNDKLFR